MNKIKLLIMIIFLLFPSLTFGESRVVWKFNDPGWYLLGWTERECLQVSDIEDPAGIIKSIWKYDSSWAVYSGIEMDNLDEICLRDGFWIEISGPGRIWQVFDSDIACETGLYEKLISDGLEIWFLGCNTNKVIFKHFDLNRDGIVDSIWYYKYRVDGSVLSISKDQNADGQIDTVLYIEK